MIDEQLPAIMGRPRFSETQRLLAFVSQIRSQPDGCWHWVGTLSRGYGQFWVGRPQRHVYAHRFAFELWRDKIPTDRQLDHLCRNRQCVNPFHLEVVTARENTLRGETPAARNHAKTHCHRGHLYDDLNTRCDHGRRHCRQCVRLASQRYRARRRANGSD